MENPEVIIEAVNTLEARQADAQAGNDIAMVKANATALFEDDTSWVGGNPDGDLVLVEFIDYRCGYCRKAHTEVEELVKSDGNIRFIVKEFPILGENSLISSRFALAARAVAGDEAYEAAHQALLAMTADATEPALRRLAGTLGLDADAVLAEMESAEITRIIGETRGLAQALQINGTPTFVMGDQMLRGYVPLDAMRQIAADIRQDS
jgi:protein-disulfide isomerase